MLTDKYNFEDGVHVAEVLDFPGAVSCGNSLDEARRNLAAALRDMAETNLLRGEALPLPDPSKMSRMLTSKSRSTCYCKPDSS